MGDVIKLERKVGAGFHLTDEEHGDLMDHYFKVESQIRMVKERYEDTGNQECDDIANCLELAMDRLLVMSHIILK